MNTVAMLMFDGTARDEDCNAMNTDFFTLGHTIWHLHMYDMLLLWSLVFPVLCDIIRELVSIH